MQAPRWRKLRILCSFKFFFHFYFPNALIHFLAYRLRNRALETFPQLTHSGEGFLVPCHGQHFCCCQSWKIKHYLTIVHFFPAFCSTHCRKVYCFGENFNIFLLLLFLALAKVSNIPRRKFPPTSRGQNQEMQSFAAGQPCRSSLARRVWVVFPYPTLASFRFRARKYFCAFFSEGKRERNCLYSWHPFWMQCSPGVWVIFEGSLMPHCIVAVCLEICFCCCELSVLIFEFQWNLRRDNR